MSILAEFLNKNHQSISEEIKLKLLSMKNIYKVWNEKINLISRKDIENIDLHHIIHSLMLASNLGSQTSRVIDVGTGGGFPGIPLAILFPQIEFILVDSINKKIRAVSEIAKEFKLDNVTTICTRVEALTHYADCVVGRAVINPLDFFKLTNHLLNSDKQEVTNTILYLSGDYLINKQMLCKFKLDIESCLNIFPNPYFEGKMIYKFFASA